MKKLQTAALLMAVVFSFGMATACGVTYLEPAGTVSGNVWHTSNGYNDEEANVEGVEVDLMYDAEGDGAYDDSYYESEIGGEEAEWETPADCGSTDANGEFNCEYVESGEYMVEITDEEGSYNDVDYVIDVFFSEDAAVSEDDGTYTEEVEIEQPLGINGGTDYISDTDGAFVRVVLTWGDASDYDAYWSFPRADFNHLMDDATSPFYPDFLTLQVSTVPRFNASGLPADYWDNSTTDSGPTDASNNKFQYQSDATTESFTEDGTNAGAFAIPAATTGVYGTDWNFSASGVTGATARLGARGVMYWNYDGTAYAAGDVPTPEAPYTYMVDYTGDGYSGAGDIAVGLDRDAYCGSPDTDVCANGGPETIFLGGIPTNNWYAADSVGNESNFNLAPYDGGAGSAFGDGLDIPAYYVGLGQYTVTFYSNQQDDEFAASRFDSSFATSVGSVSVYAKSGDRLWTFVVPDGNADGGATLAFRNWRPFYGIYQVEMLTAGGAIEENLKIIPTGFDNDILTRNGLDGLTASLRTR